MPGGNFPKLSAPNRSKLPYGSKSGSKGNAKNQSVEKVQRNQIKPPESCDSGGFLVAGEGLEPTTSGL